MLRHASAQPLRQWVDGWRESFSNFKWSAQERSLTLHLSTVLSCPSFFPPLSIVSSDTGSELGWGRSYGKGSRVWRGQGSSFLFLFSFLAMISISVP